jgi:multidrug efflux pump subunit AcrA (membrane-fusion protein)
MGNQAAMIQARAAYLLAVAQAKLDAAQSDLAEAQAHYQAVKAEQLQQLIAILQDEYARVLREQAEVDRQVDDIKRYSSQLDPIKLGRVDAGIGNAMDYFITELIPAGVLAQTMFAKVAALGIENFQVNDEEDGIDHPLLAFPGGNVGTLMKFVETHDYSFVPWSAAHGVIMDFIAAAEKAAADKTQQYQRYMDGIRSGTLPVWSLPTT